MKKRSERATRHRPEYEDIKRYTWHEARRGSTLLVLKKGSSEAEQALSSVCGSAPPAKAARGAALREAEMRLNMAACSAGDWAGQGCMACRMPNPEKKGEKV